MMFLASGRAAVVSASLAISTLWVPLTQAQTAIREGAIDSTLFHRSTILASRAALTVTTVDLSEYFPPVRQQFLDDCVGWAVAYYYKTFQEAKQRGWDPTLESHQFSPSFVYNQTNSGFDEGAGTGHAFRVLLYQGCAPLTECPLTTDYLAWPSATAYATAMKYRVAEIFYLPQGYSQSDVDALRALLLSGEAGVIDIAAYNNFLGLNEAHPDYCVADVSGGYFGHAVTVVGFDDSRVTRDGIGAFKCVNSWGTSWGDHGYFWLTYQLFQSGSVYHGAVFYAQPRENYAPTWILQAKLAHQYSGNVTLSAVLDDPAGPDPIREWNSGLGYRSPSTTLKPFPNYDIPIDISEFGSALATNPQTITLHIWDTYSDNVVGTVYSTCVRSAGGGSISCASDVPKQIPDFGDVSVPVIITTTPTRSATWGSVKGLYRSRR